MKESVSLKCFFAVVTAVFAMNTVANAEKPTVADLTAYAIVNEPLRATHWHIDPSLSSSVPHEIIGLAFVRDRQSTVPNERILVARGLHKGMFYFLSGAHMAPGSLGSRYVLDDQLTNELQEQPSPQDAGAPWTVSARIGSSNNNLLVTFVEGSKLTLPHWIWQRLDAFENENIPLCFSMPPTFQLKVGDTSTRYSVLIKSEYSDAAFAAHVARLYCERGQDLEGDLNPAFVNDIGRFAADEVAFTNTAIFLAGQSDVVAIPLNELGRTKFVVEYEKIMPALGIAFDGLLGRQCSNEYDREKMSVKLQALINRSMSRFMK